MGKNLCISSRDTKLLTEHLCSLTGHACDVSEWTKKEYMVKRMSERDISFENHREVMANSVEVKNNDRLYYTYLNKEANKKSDRVAPPLLINKAKDFKSHGRLVSDQLNLDEEWTVGGWSMGNYYLLFLFLSTITIGIFKCRVIY